MTGFVYHEDYLKHHAGFGHPESPVRLTAIHQHLASTKVLDELMLIEPYPAEISWIETNHSPDYIKHVENSVKRRVSYLDSGDTGVCPDSFDIARLAVGGCLRAADAVMEAQVENAFCAVRPPGHHALFDRAMGFCLFNNIAIAARYIQQKHNLKKILIIDWDVHHGNGTQAAFYENPSIFYFSTHQFPYYPGTGHYSEKGHDRGMGTSLNVPLSAGSGDAEMLHAFETQLTPAVREFEPEFMLISAGFDAYESDPLSDMCITLEGFERMTQIVKDLAAEYCNGRLISVLEGGYDTRALAKCVEKHLLVLMKK
ncbi:histone deacetylase [candidate division KSB1 bacterium]|nr:histone deacetylase [candidate division KSB1 bacterium]